MIHDMNDMLLRFSLDSFIEFTFGQTFNSIETYPKSEQFAIGFAICDMPGRLFERYFDPLWKIKRILKIQNEQFIAKHAKILDEFTTKLICEYENNNQTARARINLISLFLKHNRNLTLKDLKEMIFSIIMGGADTPHRLMFSFLKQICKSENMEIKKKLYTEIDTFNGLPTYIDFRKKFKYLEGCLCETLRLQPTTPAIDRECLKDIKLPLMDDMKQYTIRKGDKVILSSITMGRNPKIWGDDALIFNPLRFREKGFNAFDEYKYPVFSAGARICIGKEFAITTTKVFIYHFMKHFEFEQVETCKEGIRLGLSLKARTNCKW
eukprot:182256_1